MARQADTVQDQEAPAQKLGFFGKAKLAVTSFVKGALKSVPVTLAYSAVAFTASAIIGQQFGAGYDFLNTGNQDIGTLGVRMLGAAAIGSTISGSINSFKEVSAVSEAERQQASAPAAQPDRVRGNQQQTQFDMSPARTPVNKPQERARIQPTF